MTSLQYTILQLLADGRFHSGEQMAQATGVSRAAVWKALQELRTLGVAMHAVSGRGYALCRPLELLEQSVILQNLSDMTRSVLERFDLYHSVDSTNACLLRQAGDYATSACVAEHQSAGRGRRGRNWVSPFGGNIYLSVRWRFEEGMGRLAGLSLAVAVAVIRALREFDIHDTALKWPNDVYWQGRKLGGILLEIAGESAGPCVVVIGVGINVAMPAAPGQDIDQPWVDLVSIREGISRNELAGRLLHHLLEALVMFKESGMSSFEQEWGAADMLFGKEVVLSQPGADICGIGRGIGHDGALLLEVAGEIQRYTYGEVSPRLRERPV